MKKILYTLLAVTIIFSSCEKEDKERDTINTILDGDIAEIIADKIWKGLVPNYSNNSNQNIIIFELSSNDSLYIYLDGCISTKTSIGTWKISGRIITYNSIVNSVEYIDNAFGELTEYTENQLRFKYELNTNAICEIYNLSTQNCTYIPDNNFEDKLISLGYDDVMDNYVLKSNINNVTDLYLNFLSIYDLTGIEDFTALTFLDCGDNQLTGLDVSNNLALTNLRCYNNQLTSLDISQNTALTQLYCQSNQLTSLDVRNGNNTNLVIFYCNNNPNLGCIDVDDSFWSANYWYNIDFQHYFSENCNAK